MHTSEKYLIYATKIQDYQDLFISLLYFFFFMTHADKYMFDIQKRLQLTSILNSPDL